MDFESALKKVLSVFGLNKLKQKQVEAVKAFVTGKDVFVVLPTGYGKSIIYAVLPLLFDYMLGHKGSIVLVVTPLIALMQDQKKTFLQKGLTAEFVGDAQSDYSAVMAVLDGKVQLVYISPESLLNNKKFRSMLQRAHYQENLKALVVDEAHCIQLWGENFRKAFFEIGTLRSLLPKSVNVLALTATATKQTFTSAKEHLSMIDPVVIGLNADRTNIRYIVKPSITLQELSKILADELMSSRSKTPKTVLFCRTLKNCADIFTSIKLALGPYITDPPGLPNILQLRLITLFTAASTSDMREDILAEFCKEDTVLRLVIATSAFGLGVNIPNITRVINWGLPSTLEDLVQEMGRAGRDGSQAEAILYVRDTGKSVSKAVKEYAENKSVCRRSLLYRDFLFSGREKIISCKCCDLCMSMCNCSECKIIS